MKTDRPLHLAVIHQSPVNKEEVMNVAVIIAGGSGHRMGQDIPKQFINVYDKPIVFLFYPILFTFINFFLSERNDYQKINYAINNIKE